jgi:hypothetical protein
MTKKSKFFNNLFKKGDGLTINVIIIVVLALLVLIVISFIFGGRAQIFSSAVSKTCTEMGGKCLSTNENCTDDIPIKVLTSKKCGDNDQKVGNLFVCCVPVGAGS